MTPLGHPLEDTDELGMELQIIVQGFGVVQKQLQRVSPLARIQNFTRTMREKGRHGGAPQISCCSQREQLTCLLLAPLLDGMIKAVDGAPARKRISSARGVRRHESVVEPGRLPEDVELTAALGRLTDLQVRTALMQRPLKMIDLRNAGRVYLGPVNPPNFNAREIAARS